MMIELREREREFKRMIYSILIKLENCISNLDNGVTLEPRLILGKFKEKTQN